MIRKNLTLKIFEKKQTKVKFPLYMFIPQFFLIKQIFYRDANTWFTNLDRLINIAKERVCEKLANAVICDLKIGF